MKIGSKKEIIKHAINLENKFSASSFFRIIGLVCVLTLSTSCSKFLDVTFQQLFTNKTTTPQSDDTLVVQSGVIEKGLTFPVENESTLLNYAIECTYKATASSIEAPCASYGDNPPTVDSTSKKFVWDISANTPQGIYAYIVKKNFSDKTLTYNFSFNIDFRAPFISKWALNPDKLFTMKLDSNYNYNFIIDWGDSTPVETVTTAGTISHQYSGPATEVTIKITGELPAFKSSVIDPTDRVALITFIAPIMGVDYATAAAAFAGYTTPQISELLAAAGISAIIPPFNSKLIDIIHFGELGLQNLDNAFQAQSLLTHVGPGDLSSVTSMNGAFSNSGVPSSITFETTGWKLDNVVSAESAFSGIIFNASSDLSGITFSSKLQNASSMLARTKGNLTTAALWNLSGLTTMKSFFYYAELTNLNTTNWNIQNVIDFQYAFSSFKCTTCNYSGIHLNSKATTTEHMFNSYSGPELLVLPSFDMSEVQSSAGMFQNLDLNLFPNSSQIVVTSKNKNISAMFRFSKNLQLDTSTWNTSNVENFSELFYGFDSDMTNVNTTGIQVTAKATNLAGMFRQAENLILDTSSWDTDNVQDFSYMFTWVDSMASVNTSGIRVSENATNLEGMFAFAKDLTLNTSTSEWDTTSVVNMNSLFNNTRCASNISCNFSQIIPTNKITTLNYTFAAYATQTIDGLLGTYWTSISNFPPINTSSWDTSNVESFNGIFSRMDMAGSNLSGLSVTAKAKSLMNMFDGAQNLALNTSSWNTSNVEDARDIFSELDASAVNFAGFIPRNNIFLAGAFDGVKNATIDTSAWLLTSLADVTHIFRSGYNNIIYLNNLNLNSLATGAKAFSDNAYSYGTRIVIGATTTDPVTPIGSTYLSSANIWCADYPGVTFLGFPCQKTPFVP